MKALANERGVALPMAMIAMVILTSLMVAFISLASTEPQIANNQVASAQARALAESGIERAIWALTMGETNPGTSGALADPLPNPVPAPYNNSQYISVSNIGGFTVNVTSGPGANERTIVSKGCTPNCTSPTAVRRIQVTVTTLRFGTPGGAPLCAVCAGAESPTGTSANIQLNNTIINASTTSAPPGAGHYCNGVTPQAAHMSTGTTSATGNAQITDPGGQPGSRGGVAKSVFAPFTLTDADVAAVKALAQANGTYFQGAKTFNATTPPPNGIVFVDTTTGAPFTNATPDAEAASVTLSGNFTWSGWLIVAGSINLPSGSPNLSGMLYALNDVTINTLANINGAVVSADRKDTTSTNVDSTENKANIIYDCPAIQNAGNAIPHNWWVKPGTFSEIAG
jgi:Tfp pilus assembly protein PilX